MKDGERQEEEQQLQRERWEALAQLEDLMEWPLVVLAFAWLILLFFDLVYGLTPFFTGVVYFIWAIFIFDFLTRFIVAPEKLTFMKHNWLTAVSLLVPAFRVLRAAHAFRTLRLATALRSLRLVRVVGSLNRGMRALRNGMQKRGVDYVLTLTLIVILVGAAGMYAFERGVPNSRGFETYGDSLWWTAMIMTTMASGDWPVTGEGRILGFLLALYAFGVFGYVTATLASFLIGRETAIQNEKAGHK